MSTAITENPLSGPIISLENLLFNFPEADLILRSRDSYEFRVLKLYIIHSSPILGEKLSLLHNTQPDLGASASPAESNVEGTAAKLLGTIQLPIEGATLFSLLTYIFPVTPVLPSTVEQIMELLSVAQLYKMDAVLAHIRIHISQQEPPFIREDTTFPVYSLALKHGLRTEALQTARYTLNFPSLTIEDLAKEETLDMMPGAFLHELKKYHQRVRSNLTSDLEEFKRSEALAIMRDLSCNVTGGLPLWLRSYISNVGTGPVPTFLDISDFYTELAEHIRTHSYRSIGGCASCSLLPRTKIREFWDALTAVVHGSIAKAELDFAFPVEEMRSEGQARSTREITSLPKYLDMPNADVILKTSDLVNFRVHKSVLVASSPFFGDMFSLPQPPNDPLAASYALPVVHLSENADVLNSLISMLYPVPPEIPPSSDNILALLAAATKYDMDTVQSSIRTEVGRRGLLSSNDAGVFRVYATAYRNGLIPELEAAARLTLGHPLTFESLGDELKLFEGRALRDLVEFRLRSIRSFCSKWESFSSLESGPFKSWSNCRKDYTWIQDCRRFGSIPVERFTGTIPTSVQLRDKYLMSLQSHVSTTDCHSCAMVHIFEGENLCVKMKDIAVEAWNVPFSMSAEELLEEGTFCTSDR